jgi:hypothetical protein
MACISPWDKDSARQGAKEEKTGTCFARMLFHLMGFIVKAHSVFIPFWNASI